MNSKHFKIISILMIIFGALGAISGIVSLSSFTMGLAAGLINLVNSLLLLVAGIIGAKAAKTGDGAQIALCKKLSYALIAIAVINIVVSLIVTSGTSIPGVNFGLIMGMAIGGGVISLILPILYFFGAKKLGK